MAHLSLVPKQEVTDDLSLSNQSYQEQGMDDQVSNIYDYQDSNLVLISPASQDLGFEFEDAQPLDLEITAELEESQLTSVDMDPSISSISSAGKNCELKMNPRTRSRKKHISNSSSSTINSEKRLQFKPTTRSLASSSSKRSNKIVQKHQKSFECNWPELSTQLSDASAAVTKHQGIHSIEKPYACDWADCKLAFWIFFC